VIAVGCSSVAGCTANGAFSSFRSQAIRAFKNSVTITAASQPNCPPGTLDCLLGNVVITETQNGQFKAGDVVRGYFLPDSKSLRNDVLIKAGNTNDLPIITTNATSGLLVSPVVVICPPNIPLVNICVFAFTITQQSFGPALGQVTISNIHATIAKDATPGPIQMDWGNTAIVLGVPVGTPIGQPFEGVVSNGTIGAAPVKTAISNASASGVHVAGDGAVYTTSTKVVATGKYVTFRAHMDPSLAGERVEVWMAIRHDGAWGAFVKVSTRAVNAAGDAFFSWKTSDNTSPFTNQAGWVSVRFRFAGNSAHAAAMSLARQARFT
jgi:hypothetical protein